MGKVGHSSYLFHNVFINSFSSVVGLKEHTGPLGNYFDKYYDKLLIDGEKSFEKSEILMLKDAINICLNKANINLNEVNVCYGGDLNNQIAITNYALRDLGIPLCGVFGACATIILSIINCAFYLETSGLLAIATTSSHNCTAERQFRYPNEYGTQRANTYTSTVTGASCILLTNDKTSIAITKATIGKVVDGGFKDSQDYGRAMAPSCYHTIKTHLLDFNLSVNDYDKIYTGDLSKYGSQLLYDLFKEDGIDIKKKHEDCGNMIYDDNDINIAGGSGCGCIGVVLSGYILKEIIKQKYKKVLVCATGALMNPIMLSQKESIPAICHAITIEVIK